MKNRFNEVVPFFNLINPEFFPNNRIINTHANYFSFYLFNKHISHNIKSYIESSDVLSSIFVVTDASIKNNIAMSIVHIHICNKLIMKTLYHALNITSTKAELFVIRYGIN